MPRSSYKSLYASTSYQLIDCGMITRIDFQIRFRKTFVKFVCNPQVSTPTVAVDGEITTTNYVRNNRLSYVLPTLNSTSPYDIEKKCITNCVRKSERLVTV